MTIIAGQSTSADFSAATLINLDTDRDAVISLDELDTGTDSNNVSCVYENSIIGML